LLLEILGRIVTSEDTSFEVVPNPEFIVENLNTQKIDAEKIPRTEILFKMKILMILI
jgi:hypothetical protein